MLAFAMIRSLTCSMLLACVLGAQAETVALPKPQTEGGRPLMEALKARATSRQFSTEELSPQVLSNLLWAAWGVNRPDGRRTAPSASNRQEIDVYLTTAKGLFRYDAKAHALERLQETDLRGKTSGQSFAATAPLNLLYVADFSRMGGGESDRVFYSATDAGFIAQNVYLFCASEGLATVVRGAFDRAGLAAAMKLKPEQRIILAQTVGKPAK